MTTRAAHRRPTGSSGGRRSLAAYGLTIRFHVRGWLRAPTERYAGASRSARNRSRSSDESQTVMACSLPSTARRQPSGGTGPELRTCLLISSYCSSVRLVSSMMLQMAIRASSVGFENDRRSARSADHQCDCGFGTERLLNVLPRPRRELRAVVQPGFGEHVTDVAL